MISTYELYLLKWFLFIFTYELDDVNKHVITIRQTCHPKFYGNYYQNNIFLICLQNAGF